MAMVNDCSTMGEVGESSSASSDGIAAAEHQLDTVLSGSGECAEAEGVNAGQPEQVRLRVESSGMRS